MSIAAPLAYQMASPHHRDLEPDRLAIFMEGTANTLLPVSTQIGEFFSLVDATDVSSSKPISQMSLPADKSHALSWKMGFDGCGVTDGIAGTVWAVGLGTQCDEVIKRVRMLLEHRGKRPLHIVAVGLSRGGIGALMLATRLRKLIDQLETTGGLQGLEARIELSLLLFDPVPGNLIGVVKLLDPFKMSTAASVMDVSKAPITRVLSIYPYEPLPDLAFHAPILPTFPPTCELEEDATLGCHQGALFPPHAIEHHSGSLHDACTLSQHRVLTFLRKCNVPILEPPHHHNAWNTAKLPSRCLMICEQEVQKRLASYRAAHVAGPTTASILRHENGALLNAHHRMLLEQLKPNDARLPPKKTDEPNPLQQAASQIWGAVGGGSKQELPLEFLGDGQGSASMMLEVARPVAGNGKESPGDVVWDCGSRPGKAR